MGIVASKDNDDLIDHMVQERMIRDRNIEKAFRLVDRGHFVNNEDHADTVYRDNPWKARTGSPGQIHLSAPGIYARALAALELEPGHAFLNIGSGTGWLNTVAGFLLAGDGLNHGVEVHSNIVDHAYGCLSKTVARPEISCFPCTLPTFVWANAFGVAASGELASKYDRIYIGAGIERNETMPFIGMLKIGGRMVAPVGTELICYTRQAEALDTDVINHVQFANMIPYLRGDRRDLREGEEPAAERAEEDSDYEEEEQQAQQQQPPARGHEHVVVPLDPLAPQPVVVHEREKSAAKALLADAPPYKLQTLCINRLRTLMRAKTLSTHEPRMRVIVGLSQEEEQELRRMRRLVVHGRGVDSDDDDEDEIPALRIRFQLDDGPEHAVNHRGHRHRHHANVAQLVEVVLGGHVRPAQENNNRDRGGERENAARDAPNEAEMEHEEGRGEEPERREERERGEERGGGEERERGEEGGEEREERHPRPPPEQRERDYRNLRERLRAVRAEQREVIGERRRMERVLRETQAELDMHRRSVNELMDGTEQFLEREPRDAGEGEQQQPTEGQPSQEGQPPAEGVVDMERARLNENARAVGGLLELLGTLADVDPPQPAVNRFEEYFANLERNRQEESRAHITAAQERIERIGRIRRRMERNAAATARLAQRMARVERNEDVTSSSEDTTSSSSATTTREASSSSASPALPRSGAPEERSRQNDERHRVQRYIDERRPQPSSSRSAQPQARGVKRERDDTEIASGEEEAAGSDAEAAAKRRRVEPEAQQTSLMEFDREFRRNVFSLEFLPKRLRLAVLYGVDYEPAKPVDKEEQNNDEVVAEKKEEEEKEEKKDADGGKVEENVKEEEEKKEERGDLCTSGECVMDQE